MMNDERKQKLMELGVEVLADSLLNLAVHSDDMEDLIEGLIATPKENVLRFKKKLSGLKRRTRFIGWRESHAFSNELTMMLQLVQSGVKDPKIGMELVVDFFEADGSIFEMCDDSSGTIGTVFRYDAKNLFVAYASHCAEKDWIADIILRVTKKDDYGIRDALINCAGDCLPEAVIRSMIARLQDWADQAEDEYAKRHHLRAIESLARQIKDAELFERTRMASWGKLNTAAMIDIARVYLESGELDQAHAWLTRISGRDTFQASERDALLKELYQKQGDSEKLAELLFRTFRTHPSKHTLQALVDMIGQEKREEVVAMEVAQILKSEHFQMTDAEFLISVEKIDEAEVYLLNHAARFDGHLYSSLLSLAEAMEFESRWLLTSLIYRSLLTAILERGYTKAYPHGVRYLMKLDYLSVAVADWKEWNDHEAFKEQIIQVHGRKHSFWSRVEG
jgi:hypothetical protein